MMFRTTRNTSDLEGQYDYLKYRVMMECREHAAGPLTIVFTSYASGEGVSTVAANFALALSSEPDMSILLVDFNLMHPSLHRHFEVNGNGHSQAKEPAEGVEAQTEEKHLTVRERQLTHYQPNMDVILSVSGRPSAHNRVITMGDIDVFLQTAKKRYDVVIVDCPSLSSCSYAFPLAAKADGAVLVVEAGRVRGEPLKWAVQQLETIGANILGVVLNKRIDPIPNMIYRKL
jgi:polysaccharide biosynthesis transport protein